MIAMVEAQRATRSGNAGQREEQMEDNEMEGLIFEA